MKKFIGAFVSLLLVAALSGCGSVPANTVFSLDDLPGKTIGVQTNTTGDVFASDYEDAEKYGENVATVERFKTGNDAIMALKQGKIDCIILDEQTAEAFVAGNKGLKILEEDFGPEDYAICLKKGSELYAEINGALNELMQNGTFQSIVDNYIGENAGKSPYKTPEGTEYTKGTLKMATNAYFPPYEYYEGGVVVGIDVDVAKAICDKLGYELQIEDMDFEAIIGAVQSGKCDFGMAGMTVTEDRLKSVDFTDSYTQSKQVIIVRDK